MSLIVPLRPMNADKKETKLDIMVHTRYTIYPYRYIKDVIDCLLFRYSHTLGTLWPICIRFTLLLLYGTYGTIRDIWGVFLYFVIH